MTIAFDYDGVLVDVREDNIAVINRLAKKYGFDPVNLEQYNASLQYNFYEYWQMLLGSKAQEFFKDLHAIHRAPAKLLPGMQDILLVHKPVIISSNVTYLIKNTLNSHGIDLEVVGGDIDTSKVRKLTKYKTEPAIFVTDTAGDIIEGKQAGYITVAVTWGFNTREQLQKAQPDFIVETPGALEELLARLCNVVEQEILVEE